MAEAHRYPHIDTLLLCRRSGSEPQSVGMIEKQPSRERGDDACLARGAVALAWLGSRDCSRLARTARDGCFSPDPALSADRLGVSLSGLWRLLVAHYTANADLSRRAIRRR
jgi:hypothetical protein